MKSASNVDYQLDAIDKEIIYMLMDNAKTSLAHISKNVGISTTAVHQRIKKLEQAGVIENSISFLNPRKIFWASASSASAITVFKVCSSVRPDCAGDYR